MSIKVSFLLFLASFSLVSFSQNVVINEVCNKPKYDWSSTSFDGQIFGQSTDSRNEWIELYVKEEGLNFTSWTLEMNDGTAATGIILSSSGTINFEFVNYISKTGGTITNSKPGDYIVLGNPLGTMEDVISLVLKNSLGQIIDQVQVGALGTPNVLSTTLSIETVARIPNGTDSNLDVLDFKNSFGTLGFANSKSGKVLINEVITDPQQNWSANGFTGILGISSPSTDDEWVELFVQKDSLNLSIFTLDMNDGLSAQNNKTLIQGSSNFNVLRYISASGGNLGNSKAGDYLILGNPVGDMNNSISLVLKNSGGEIVDQVALGGIGNASSGASSSFIDESICRLNNGKDSDVDANDFYKTIASLGRSNSPAGKVVINEIVTSPHQDFDGNVTVSDAADEYIELYIASDGMNLTGYTLDIIDGSDNILKGNFVNGGVFASSTYVSANSGAYYSTKAGDYYYLLNPNHEMNNNTKVILYDASGNKIDSLPLALNNYPSGNSSDLGDESVSRIPNGIDTDQASDFSDALATPGAENKVYTLSNFPPRPGSGYCLEFNGSSQSVSLGKPIALNLQSNFTIEQWIFPTTSGGAFSFKGHYNSPTANSGWTASVDGSTIVWNLRNNNEVTISTPENSIAFNEWQHIALVMNGTNASIYINGVLCASGIAAIRTNLNYDFYMGKRGYIPVDKYFPGKIDEVRIWSKALTENEIRTYMCQKITPSIPIYSNLLSYYTFDTGSGSTLFDFKSVNYGRISGSPIWKISGAPLGNESVFNYPITSNWEDEKVILNTSEKGDLIVKNVLNAPAGIQIYKSTISANTTKGLIAPKTSTDSYFGVFPIKSLATNDAPNYDIAFSYADNEYFSSGEKKLLVAARIANEDTIWANSSVSKQMEIDSVFLNNTSKIEFLPYVSDTNNFTLSSGFWSENSNWFFGIPDSTEIVEISAFHTVNLDSDLTVSGIKLNEASTLNIATNTLELIDSTIVLDTNAFVNASNGTVVYSKVGNQNIAPLEYGKLILDNSGIKSFPATTSVTKSLKINSSSLHADLTNLTFLSNISQTASLEEVPNGAIISGSATVESTISATERTWYHLSSPINGAKLSEWMDDFSVTGNFVGASTTSGSNKPSIYWYDETVLSDKEDQKWLAFPSSVGGNTQLETGRGYRVFLRKDAQTALGDTTIDLVGQVNYGELEIPVSYTFSTPENEATAGWNFIGNPYPSSIDWDANDWEKTNLENAIYVWDAGLDPKYACYVDGVSVNGGSNLIAAGQGFWVKANALFPELTISESVKSTVKATLLRPQNSEDLDYVTITLLDSNKVFSTILRYAENATADFDASKDARFFGASSLAISTYFGNDYYAINTLPIPKTENELELNLQYPNLKKKYKLNFDFTGNPIAKLDLYLKDTYLDKIVKISDDLDYSFELNQDLNSVNSKRFSILQRPSEANGFDFLNSEGKLTIYPNPVRKEDEFIFLELNENLGNEALSLQFYTLLGAKVFEYKSDVYSEFIKIPASELESGIYLLQVLLEDNKTQSFKLYVE